MTIKYYEIRAIVALDVVNDSQAFTKVNNMLKTAVDKDVVLDYNYLRTIDRTEEVSPCD